MIVTLALRNLLHDRVRFAATVIGIVFSVILVAVQLGLYISFSR
jgi:putative ABC transport system permease protein